MGRLKSFARGDGLRAHWQTQRGQKCLDLLFRDLMEQMLEHHSSSTRQKESFRCGDLWGAFLAVLDSESKSKGCLAESKAAEDWIAHIKGQECELAISQVLLERAFRLRKDYYQTQPFVKYSDA